MATCLCKDKRYIITKEESPYLFKFLLSKLSYPKTTKTKLLINTIYLFIIELPNYYHEEEYVNRLYDWYFHISKPAMTIDVTGKFIEKNIKGPKKLVEWAVLRMKR